MFFFQTTTRDGYAIYFLCDSAPSIVYCDLLRDDLITRNIVSSSSRNKPSNLARTRERASKRKERVRMKKRLARARASLFVISSFRIDVNWPDMLLLLISDAQRRRAFYSINRTYPIHFGWDIARYALEITFIISECIIHHGKSGVALYQAWALFNS